MNSITTFYNQKVPGRSGEKVAEVDGILPISLYKGMQISVHGREEQFEITRWGYYFGGSDEKSELRIILNKLPDSQFGKMKFGQQS